MAFEINPEYKKEGYLRFFICPDVNDYWFVRIIGGVNEDYEKEEGSFLIERNNIPKAKKENLTLRKVKKIIEEDDCSNWDTLQGFDLEQLIDELDCGFGMINRK